MKTEIATCLECAAEAGGPRHADLNSIVANCRRMRIHATSTRAAALTSSAGGTTDSVDETLDSVLASFSCVPDGLLIPAPSDIESIDMGAPAAGSEVQEGSVAGSRTDA